MHSERVVWVPHSTMAGAAYSGGGGGEFVLGGGKDSGH